MITIARRFTALGLGILLLFGASTANAAPAPSDAPAPDGPIGRTPPRLSYVEGEVSFWRPGAADWAPAQINTALVPGDETYTGNRGNLELQIGARAFVRAWGDTQLGLVNQEPDFLQLKVTGGHVSVDLRAVEPGRTVEVDTPVAAFTIDAPGYYRVDVSPDRTSFITRRSGRATMTPAGGTAVAIAPSEEIVLAGAPTLTIQSFVAPTLDVWDTWNYARTDELIDSLSARYVPSGVYGVDDLDHHGNWRVVPTYGAVWVPRDVPGGWAPYSTGRWVADPRYGWTWVDEAPWGWAPYHHGRWVFVDGYWAWAPGPVVVRPVYAPALVAFFGAPGVRVAVGTPFVSWVALGWGEPVIPWWGSPRFVGRPWWAGWGGPRRPVARVAPPETGRERAAPAITAPAPRIVPAPKPAATAPAPRAPFGTSSIERERATTPPRFESRTEPRADAQSRGQTPREPRAEVPRPETARPESRPEMARPEPTRPEMTRPEAARPEPARPEMTRPETSRPQPRAETPRPEVGRPREATPRALPGEPANRVSPWRRESTAPRPSTLTPGRATAPGPTRAVERDDARRTPPRSAVAHTERDERRTRAR